MMELKKLTVHNYKSLVNFELNEPNAFTVFAGPNGAGKSNIFEALEFISYLKKLDILEVEKFFGGRDQIRNVNSDIYSYEITIKFNSFENRSLLIGKENDSIIWYPPKDYPGVATPLKFSKEFKDFKKNNPFFAKSDLINKKFYKNFLHLFINKSELNHIKYTSNERLLPDASNLEPVLKRILKDELIKEEFLE